MSSSENVDALSPSPVASGSTLSIGETALISVGSDDAPACADGLCSL
jgi:hypothetical protein